MTASKTTAPRYTMALMRPRDRGIHRQRPIDQPDAHTCLDHGWIWVDPMAEMSNVAALPRAIST